MFTNWFLQPPRLALDTTWLGSMEFKDWWTPRVVRG